MIAKQNSERSWLPLVSCQSLGKEDSMNNIFLQVYTWQNQYGSLFEQEMIHIAL